MTANQIAAESNRERERDNRVTAAETERHNKAVEANDVRAMEITQAHNQNMYELQKDYNRAYLDYLNSSEENRDEREREKNRIQERMNDAEAQYKREMSVINQAQQRADEMYKSAMTEVSLENLNLETKRSYYQNQKTEAEFNNIRAQTDLLYKRFDLDKDRIEKQYELGLIDASTRQQELKNAQNRLEYDITRLTTIDIPNAQAERALKQSQTARNYSSIASDWADAIIPDF